MVINVEYEVDGCYNCPFIKRGTNYGMDGRDSRTVYVCEKGAFGGKNEWGDFGFNTMPKVAPYGCPYFNNPPIDRVASKLDIDVKKLEKILNEEHCIITDIYF